MPTLIARCMAAAMLCALPAAIAGQAAAQDLRIGSEIAPNSMDPHWHNFGGNKSFAPHVFEPLVLLDADQRPVAALAADWRATDPTSWTFRLRDGVRFHDGSALTAEDIAFTLRRAADVPGSPSSFAVYLRAITAVETPDAQTVVLRTAEPFPLMPVYLSQVPVVSRRAGEGATTADYNSGRAAIGTGPYRLVSWTAGDSVALARNEAYRDGPAPWARVTLRSIPQAAARVAALLAGDADVIDAVPAQDLPRLEADRRIAVATSVSPAVAGFHLDVVERVPPGILGNDGQPLPRNPFADRRVREAVSLAIQRDAIVDRVMGGHARVANQFMPAGGYGHAPGLPPIPFDPARSRALLAAAGYPDGFRLTIHCQNNRFVNDAQICQAVAQMLTRAGIRTTVDAMPHALHVTRSRNREFSLWTGLWGVETGEPTAPLATLVATVDERRGRGQFNRGRYSNAAFDQLLDRALVEIDDAAREGLLIQATELAFGDVALIPLHHQVNIWAHRRQVAFRPRVDGYTRAMSVSPVP
ncbi:ABC transporter substrate-binding protein [Falsiroseomonas oryzae]|uniref:ABC transporter substrate-binding protein n=1 Tax=Falsiroseomonas oryzae TaxID=2766473 RepID=UPI0022EACC9D|nr:ABC transporter substrate-binding protein [Roseomonas sp. MO-31]